MKGEPRLYIDQYGNCFWARTLKQLRAKVPGRVSKLYVDKQDGSTRHIGYVIGDRWLTAYVRFEVLA